jgi:hypothetical protein
VLLQPAREVAPSTRRRAAARGYFSIASRCVRALLREY